MGDLRGFQEVSERLYLEVFRAFQWCSGGIGALKEWFRDYQIVSQLSRMFQRVSSFRMSSRGVSEGVGGLRKVQRV